MRRASSAYSTYSKASYIFLVASIAVFTVSLVFSIFSPSLSASQTEEYENLVLLEHDETLPAVLATVNRDNENAHNSFGKRRKQVCLSFHVDSLQAAIIGRSEETFLLRDHCSWWYEPYSSGDQVKVKYVASLEEYKLVDGTYIEKRVEQLFWNQVFSRGFIVISVISGVSMLGLIWLFWSRKKLPHYWPILGVGLVAVGICFAIDANALNSRLGELKTITDNSVITQSSQSQARFLGTISLPSKNVSAFQILLSTSGKNNDKTLTCPIFELSQAEDSASRLVIDRFSCGPLNLSVNDEVALRYDDSVLGYVLQGANGEALVEAGIATVKINLRNTIAIGALFIIVGFGFAIVSTRRCLRDATDVLEGSEEAHSSVVKSVALTIGSLVIGGATAFLIGLLDNNGSSGYLILFTFFVLLLIFIGFIVWRARLVKSLQERAYSKSIGSNVGGVELASIAPEPKRSTRLWCGFVASFSYFCFTVMMFALTASSSVGASETETQLSSTSEKSVVVLVLFSMTLLFVWFSVERQVRTYVKNLENEGEERISKQAVQKKR